MIKVTPEVVLGDLSLKKSFSPEQRKCYFDGERELQYFAIYSESNCDLECVSNISQELCNCVAFWMPRKLTMRLHDSLVTNHNHFLGHNGMRTCGVKDLKCYTRNIYRYLNVEKAFTSAGDLQNTYGRDFHTQFQCNCLPRCNSITYTFPNDKKLELRPDYDDDESPADDVDDDNNDNVDKGDYIKLIGGGGGGVGVGIGTGGNRAVASFGMPRFELSPLREAHVAIAFKRAQILALKRSPFYQLSDFIANVGGLLGLFVGMSLLSVVEVFYFLTLRLIDKCRRQKPNTVIAGGIPMVVVIDQDADDEKLVMKD